MSNEQNNSMTDELREIRLLVEAITKANGKVLSGPLWPEATATDLNCSSEIAVFHDIVRIWLKYRNSAADDSASNSCERGGLTLGLRVDKDGRLHAVACCDGEETLVDIESAIVEACATDKITELVADWLRGMANKLDGKQVWLK